ncbi:MAG: DUF4864 domain-containing protein [Acidobacteria bacterium]|nr:DUF4864 domain-containing protein [Acidobacteriota bacterium]
MDSHDVSGYQRITETFVSASAPAARSRKRSGITRRLRRTVQALGIGLMVAAGSLLFLMALFWVRSQGAVAVVQAQIEDLRGGKVEEAYALFSRSYRAGVSLAAFRGWVERQERLIKAQRVEFWGRSVWGETATLWGTFHDDLGHSYPVRYVLIRENGSWRVDGLRLAPEVSETPSSTVRIIQI